jgi:hypothetical protein
MNDVYKSSYCDHMINTLNDNNSKICENCSKIFENYSLKEFTVQYEEKYNKNAYEFLINYLLFKEEFEIYNDIDVMVGCTNTSEEDYKRFDNNNKYLFYIDNDIDKNEINTNRQYKMFTIDYKDIDERFPKNIISNINFDTGVSNFAPNKYLDISEKILKPGGIITFDIIDHGGIVLMFKEPNKLYYINNNLCLSDDEIHQLEINMKIIIDFDNKKLVPNGDYYKDCNMSPQIQLVVYCDLNFSEKFKNCSYDKYLNYCEMKYPSMIFTEVSHSFLDYKYPTEMRIINKTEYKIDMFNEVVNILVNEIMNLDERIKYIKTKKMSLEKIDELIERIKYNNKYNEILTNISQGKKIDDLIFDTFLSQIKYVKCRKL